MDDADLTERINAARREGWNSAIAFLMAGGQQTGVDYFEGGTFLGRFNSFFPAGSTPDGRAAHYAKMAEVEVACKNTEPLDFGDLSWVDATSEQAS